MPFKGLDAHRARLRRLANVGSEVQEALVETAKEIAQEADRSIGAGSASGKPSRPGQAPNRQSGELQDGIRVVEKGPGVVEVQSTAPHARPLEFGTSKIAPRPYLRPARDKKVKALRKKVAGKVSTKIKRR